MKYIFAITVSAATLVAGAASMQTASAGTCVTKTGYHVPHNCSAVGRTATGRIIMICC